MWDYTDTVRDHYLNPRNVGKIENPDGFGEVGNIKCGDALQLTFRVNAEEKIEEIKFQTFGCGSAIAASSVLTELSKGLSLDEAGKITNEDIAQALGGLPREKMHCSVMGQEALKDAIQYYRNGRKKVESTDKGRLICACFNVYENELVEQIRLNGLTSVEQVTNYVKAGGGCGACIHDIEETLVRVNQEMDTEHIHSHTVDEKPVEQKNMTNLEKIDRIRKVLDEDIRPVLARDGGDCELVDFVENTVKIRLLGSCSGCAFSQQTSDGFIEKTLKEKVLSELTVERV